MKSCAIFQWKTTVTSATIYRLLGQMIFLVIGMSCLNSSPKSLP